MTSILPGKKKIIQYKFFDVSTARDEPECGATGSMALPKVGLSTSACASLTDIFVCVFVRIPG